MKQLFGITNNNIVTVANALRQFRASLPEEKQNRIRFNVLGFEDAPDFDKHNIFLVPTARKFLRHLEEFNTSNAIVYVFDTPVLCDNLQPIQLLDVESKSHSYRYVYKSLDYDYITSSLRYAFKSDGVMVKMETVNVIPTMLSELRGSIIQILFTYLYTIKDSDRKGEHRNAVLDWLLTDASIEALRVELTSLNSGKVTKSITYLVNKLESLSDVVTKTKAAFIHIQGLRKSKINKKTNTPLAIPYKKIALSYSVDAFDLRYVMKILRSKPTIENKSFSDIYTTRRSDGSGKRKIKPVAATAVLDNIDATEAA